MTNFKDYVLYITLSRVKMLCNGICIVLHAGQNNKNSPRAQHCTNRFLSSSKGVLP